MAGALVEALRAGELLCGGTMARLYRTTAEDEKEAFAYFRRHRASCSASAVRMSVASVAGRRASLEFVRVLSSSRWGLR